MAGLNTLLAGLIITVAGTGSSVTFNEDGFPLIDGPVLMLRSAGDEWTLLAVNENDQRVSFTVKGLPSMLNGKPLYRLDADEKVQVQSGQFHDGIRAYGVHVYSTSRLP